MTPRISVLILTFNEAHHIERAIASVKRFAHEVVVVDSGSTDNTVSLAEAAGARVLTYPFKNYSTSFQWGLDHGLLTGDWIMRLDADEVIGPALASEILDRTPRLDDSITGIRLKRQHVFMEKHIRYGGRATLDLLRLWRTGVGRIEQRWMDEHIILSHGATVKFRNSFVDHNLGDLHYFTSKHNSYATREALDIVIRQHRLGIIDDSIYLEAGSPAAKFKRYIKEQVYNNIPFPLGVILAFLFRFFIQLGFLDGREGLIYHGLQGLWYRFLVGARVIELRSMFNTTDSADRKIEIISKATGYQIR